MRVPLSPCASVVVPVHRIIPRLRGCLEALRAQSERPEIVLSLDGPVDLAPELAALADLVVEGPRTGPAGARNRGWKAASGKLILFTDSDCVPEPGWASALIAGLEEGADGCKGVYSRGGVRLIQRLAQVEFEQRYEMLSRKETIDLVDTYSAGFRRSALERVGGFDESFPAPDSEDVDLSWRLCAAGFHLAFVPGARVEHEHRPTWRAYFQLKLSRGRWRMKALGKFPGKAARDSYTPLSLKLQMLLAGLLLPAAAASALIPAAAPVWLGAFLLACIPLAKVALRVDPVVAHAIPAFCLVRGTALLAGTARGLLGGF
jgi:GT2 family glycosyltransferase